MIKIYNHDREQHGQNLREADYTAIHSAFDQIALVSMTDAEGNIIYANKNFVTVSQYSVDELLGQNHRILKSGHQPQQLFVDMWKTISSNRIWRGEIKNRAKNGEYYWVDTYITPISSISDKPERYISVRFLITEKKKMEEDNLTRLKELEDTKNALLSVLEDLEQAKKYAITLTQDLKKFKLAIDNTSEMVIITDPEGIVLYGNKAIEKITGYKPEEAIGKKSGSLWKAPMPQAFYQKMWNTIKKQKKTFVGEIQNKKKNGKLYQAIVNISPVVNEKGGVEFFVGIERDVTREKEINSMKTEFLSVAAHQLRTPLGSMRWNLEMLLGGDYGDVPEGNKEAIKQIYASNIRLITLVNDLLDVSRIDQGQVKDELKLTDVVAIIKETIKDVQQIADKKSVTLSVVLEKEHIPEIVIDPQKLREVTENLLSNAVKYNYEGGRVVVEIKKLDNILEIKVKDTGMGIPKNEYEKVYLKFFRGENAIRSETEGTGLGLFVVKSYVERWGGKVFFESVEGKGTTFTITIPLRNEK